MQTEIILIEQRTVIFYGDEITIVQGEQDGNRVVFVPIRPITRLVGVDWDAQRRRIQRDPVLSEVAQGVVVTTTPSQDGRGGGSQEMTCLPLDYLNGWLFGINANRVKVESRDALIRYQKDCYRVLADAFKAGELSPDSPFSDLLKRDTPAVRAYHNAHAIMELARNQVILESRLDDYEQRLETLEATIGDPGRHITPEQAMHISQAVKAIALEMGRRSGRNEFNGIYGELYRRFKVPSYRELPAKQFDEAMAFLRDWWQALTDIDEVPF